MVHAENIMNFVQKIVVGHAASTPRSHPRHVTTQGKTPEVGLMHIHAHARSTVRVYARVRSYDINIFFIAFLDDFRGPTLTKSGTTMVVPVVPCDASVVHVQP